MLSDALDRIPIELKLADHRGRKANPRGVQLRKRDRPLGRPAQLVEQPLLLRITGRHKWIVALRSTHATSQKATRRLDGPRRRLAHHRHTPAADLAHRWAAASATVGRF
jgi:hypothetical protein